MSAWTLEITRGDNGYKLRWADEEVLQQRRREKEKL